MKRISIEMSISLPICLYIDENGTICSKPTIGLCEYHHNLAIKEFGQDTNVYALMLYYYSQHEASDFKIIDYLISKIPKPKLNDLFLMQNDSIIYKLLTSKIYFLPMDYHPILSIKKIYTQLSIPFDGTKFYYDVIWNVNPKIRFFILHKRFLIKKLVEKYLGIIDLLPWFLEPTL